MISLPKYKYGTRLDRFEARHDPISKKYGPTYMGTKKQGPLRARSRRPQAGLETLFVYFFRKSTTKYAKFGEIKFRHEAREPGLYLGRIFGISSQLDT